MTAGDASEFVRQMLLETAAPTTDQMVAALARMHGREAVRQWIVPLMKEPPNSLMTYTHDWVLFDEGNGRVVLCARTHMPDLGDGIDYSTTNWTRIDYAGDGRWSREETSTTRRTSGRCWVTGRQQETSTVLSAPHNCRSALAALGTLRHAWVRYSGVPNERLGVPPARCREVRRPGNIDSWMSFPVGSELSSGLSASC